MQFLAEPAAVLAQRMRLHERPSQLVVQPHLRRPFGRVPSHISTRWIVGQSDVFIRRFLFLL
jgi:hypothetical protein